MAIVSSQWILYACTCSLKIKFKITFLHKCDKIITIKYLSKSTQSSILLQLSRSYYNRSHLIRAIISLTCPIIRTLLQRLNRG